MKAVILAAGYATRLYPLTENKAKPLLEIGNRPLVEHLLEKINEVKIIDHVYIVTNAKFYDDFVVWSRSSRYFSKVTILNDGTETNETRLGAIGDITYVINEANIEEDVMIAAGDNLFSFDFQPFVHFFYEKQTDCIIVQSVSDQKELQRTGVAAIKPDGLVTGFEEKPECPKTSLAVPPIYLYKKETIKLLGNYLQSGNNPDAPGNFIPWLIKHKNVYAYPIRGACYDIGTLESYQKISKMYAERK
ncbi:glucose-1-phosphate thymidylyltransferase [Gracilibacillus ureilyticus]|uniref:Glucose-1-phosphate thymidylyltransferase n=1 Tax=Gracilibacillus ureilyticus TaxID=531814 RepID=A0A1H9R5D6_9BACI|nr:nucleotidyltransferase family protein [Gracilibacillus ureilyticus]SER67936.1 glucose-1-phosphate thymidylyltransferase [Gracilibacillus ureilyticus]